MRQLISIFLFFFLTSALPALASMQGVPGDGELAFTVTRNDKPIGRQVFNFESENGLQIVRVRTRIVYELLGVVLYRFDHDSTEIWRRGRMISLSSRTNDDGEKLELEARAEGPDLLVRLNGKDERLKSTNFPASLWNPLTVDAKSLVDTVNGEHLDVEGKRSDHFTLSGELARDLWYDDFNLLKEVKFTARDGSEIRYVRD